MLSHARSPERLAVTSDSNYQCIKIQIKHSTFSGVTRLDLFIPLNAMVMGGTRQSIPRIIDDFFNPYRFVGEVYSICPPLQEMGVCSSYWLNGSPKLQGPYGGGGKKGRKGEVAFLLSAFVKPNYIEAVYFLEKQLCFEIETDPASVPGYIPPILSAVNTDQ